MIHQYRNNGYNIVMDVYSGSVHVEDDVCYDEIAEVNSVITCSRMCSSQKQNQLPNR